MNMSTCQTRPAVTRPWAVTVGLAILFASMLILGLEGNRAQAYDRLTRLSAAPENRMQQPLTDTVLVYLPVTMHNWPPVPVVPNLQPIDNPDLNNAYVVFWNYTSDATSYVLEQATNAAFTNAVVVYAGPGTQWSTPASGQLSASYFYRVKAVNAWTSSAWSAVQAVTIYPLYVGLTVRWDGVGYARGSSSFYLDVGTHETKYLDLLTDATTVRSVSHFWYDPNPEAWADDNWFTYYSVPTGQWLASSSPGDPSWKWGVPWFLAYGLQLGNGGTVYVDGQPFTVTGPLSGYTSYGQAVQYWQLVNQAMFVYHDAGDDWVQYVHPGEAILRFDAGGSRLQLHSDVKRHYYYQGQLTQFTVQYIDNLTAASSLPGLMSLATDPTATIDNDVLAQPDGTQQFAPPLDGLRDPGHR
jgi:hypothetical protein